MADCGANAPLTRKLDTMHTVPITAQLVEQRLEHWVTEEVAAASRQSQRYEGLCGRRFIAAPLSVPPGRPCPDCTAVLAAVSQPATPPGNQPRHRRHGLMQRLLSTAFVERSDDR